MSENYGKMKQPPKTALREIQAGDLKGKTDINPQWRYEIMDTTFGACGEKWKYEIVKLWDYPTQDGTVLCFAQVNVYVKTGDTWSDPIPGMGGNTLVDMVKGYTQGDPKRAKPNDEGYKMAITDALGTALKMLGVAADIYSGRWDGSRYRDDEPDKGDKETPEYVKLKLELIDWLNVEPSLLSDKNNEWVNKMITDKNLTGMNNAIDLFNKASKKRRDNE